MGKPKLTKSRPAKNNLLRCLNKGQRGDHHNGSPLLFFALYRREAVVTTVDTRLESRRKQPLFAALTAVLERGVIIVLAVALVQCV